MEMLEKISDLKNQSQLSEVNTLCEIAISAFSTTIYNDVPQEAKIEIEKLALNNLFEGLSKIKDKTITDWVANEKRIYTVKNLGVRDAIYNLRSEKVGTGLGEILESFRDRLEYTHEALLYEEFISAVNAFNYFPNIGHSIESIKEKVNNYKNDVDITKIIETMKETKSGYLIPLIETYVNNYLNEKTEQNKSFLKEALTKFAYDPFVKDIISIVTLDAKNLQLEYANAECDIEKIYSPLIYLGENEAVFNLKGNYYIKKGNVINRFPKNDIEKLDEEFVTLCSIINLDTVEIDSKGVHVFENDDYAHITENDVTINEQVFTDADFAYSAEQSKLAGNDKFFYLVETIRANFNEIAEVDFVKRVFLKEDANHSADVFKLRDNVFIATHNPDIAKTTFYRNVNPIQAKNIMLEHLNFDVSKTFKGILPHEEKINAEINESKKAFGDYITLLEGKIAAMSSQTVNDVTIKVLEALNEELSDVKADYKDYLNGIERYMRAPEDIDVSNLDENEKVVVTIAVGEKKYVVPIPDAGSTGGDGNGEGAESEAGTIVGTEDVENTAASEITFDDGESELLGDSPSIQDDQINLGSDEIEQDAEDAEDEAEKEEEEAEAEGDEFEEEGDSDLDLGDEADEDNDYEEEQEEEPKKKKKKKKKKEKNESLEKTTFINDSAESTDESSDSPKKRKVFLLKKKK